MAAQVDRRRFTVRDYYQMIDTGILADGERVELIDGEIFRMSPINAKHAGCVNRTNAVLREQIPEGDAVIAVQNPLRLGEDTEPQPDIAVLRPRADYYSAMHPTARDVLLLVEVADSSITYDRNVKLPLFARAGIPEAWLADINGHGLERHTEPTEKGYQMVVRAGRGKSPPSTTVPGFALAVDAVLGQAASS